MKVFYTGVNLYGQFQSIPDELIVESFTEVTIDEEILFYAMSLTYSVMVTNKNIIVRGFFNGRPYQNFKIRDFDVQTMQQISCNETHILILDKNGVIWQLKALNGDKFQPITNFIQTESKNQFELNDIIVKLYCGKNMNLAVSKLGYLYSIPTRLQLNNVVKDVACGQEHGILLCGDGRVYTWGVGTRGQLGHGDLEYCSDPKLVVALDGIKIEKIAAGGWHCAVLSKEGDVYSWGWNSNGQLGFCNDSITLASVDKKDSVSILFTPRVLNISSTSINTHIIDISCGMRHTLILQDDGTLYGSGFNKYNQLGVLDNNAENVCEMTRILKIKILSIDKVHLKCGPYCSTFFLYE